jgi:glutaconate CoA-transferase subunit A
MKPAAKTKVVDLVELAGRIPDGAMLALGGSFLHRGPFALVRELIRGKRRDLEIVKQSPGYDVDILCRAHCVRRLRAGIVAMEGNFGLAQWFRRAVETGEIELEEHACMSLTAGLRAAAFGVPFQPVGGLFGSDIPAVNDWKTVTDPYGSGEAVYVIPAIAPEVCVIHVNEVDAEGNARLYGTPFWDRVMTRASKRLLITAERLVSGEEIRRQPELTLVPGFMVEALAIVPQGAWPGSTHPDYEVDYAAVTRYLDDSPGALERHLAAAPEAKAAANV